MRRIDTKLPGVCVIEHPVYTDNRGSFTESYNQDRLKDLGIHCTFVQDNHSVSAENVFRGLHYQSGEGQIKLVRCTVGEITDVVVDIRPDSPTFRQWIGINLKEDDNKMIYIPVGFAHGFYVVRGPAHVQYKCSSPYRPQLEKTIRWDDPHIIPQLRFLTPHKEMILSDRDKNGMTLEEACKS